MRDTRGQHWTCAVALALAWTGCIPTNEIDCAQPGLTSYFTGGLDTTGGCPDGSQASSDCAQSTPADVWIDSFYPFTAGYCTSTPNFDVHVGTGGADNCIVQATNVEVSRNTALHGGDVFEQASAAIAPGASCAVVGSATTLTLIVQSGQLLFTDSQLQLDLYGSDASGTYTHVGFTGTRGKTVPPSGS